MSSKEQVVFDLDAAAFSSDEFRMYNFKARGAARRRGATGPRVSDGS